MKELEEQRVCVKFCCKLGKNFTETFQLLNHAYGEDFMSLTQCYEWFKRFEKGRMSVGEEPRPGRPSTSTDDDHVERVRAVIRGNRRLTVREVANEVGISIGSCHQILRPELWENQTWMLHHDNAPAHASLLIRSYLAKHQTPVVPHPPYSPDLAPADFFLFPKLKTTLKGRRFQTIEEIQENATIELRAITSSAFQEAFQKWKKRWERCIASRGDYFEGDSA
jgi:transposase